MQEFQEKMYHVVEYNATHISIKVIYNHLRRSLQAVKTILLY